jgi:hypothetical protein
MVGEDKDGRFLFVECNNCLQVACLPKTMREEFEKYIDFSKEDSVKKF